MRNVIVIGSRLESSGPEYLLPQIWKPENWVLVRHSALALHTSCTDGDRMLVSGINTHPPVGTIIIPSEICSFPSEYSEYSLPSGIWMYVTEYDRQNIDAHFRISQRRFAIELGMLPRLTSVNHTPEMLTMFRRQILKG